MPRNKKTIIVFLTIFLLGLFFRIGSLERPLLGDELKWTARSTKFFNAVITGNLKDTFSTAHPGVTLMWLSGGSFWLFSEISGDMEMFKKIAKTEHISPTFPEEYIHELPGILKTMRLPLAILSAFLIAIIFLLLKILIGFKLSFLSALLIAVDPFITANNRIVHLDGLLALFMALSVICLAVYLKTASKKIIYLTGIFTGLSLLTKLPSFFLLPFLALILFAHYSKKGEPLKPCLFLTLKKILAISGIAILTFIILWPAMWVQPVKSLYQGNSIHSIFSNIPYEIKVPHKSNFFLGKQTEKVGLLFYPVTILFKTTFFSLIFFILALAFLTIKKHQKQSLLIFLSFILLFGLVMSLGAKKGDRYILPIYPFIDILAIWAFYKILNAVGRIKKWSFLITLLIIAILGIHIFTYSPYSISYFNPLVGGGKVAQKAYVIGLGEGLDLAAEYLNKKSKSENLKVASWYSCSFKPFFKGKTYTEREAKRQDIDYIVLYINGIQRKLPAGLYEDYFLKKTPEKVIKIKNLEYAWIYKKE